MSRYTAISTLSLAEDVTDHVVCMLGYWAERVGQPLAAYPSGYTITSAYNAYTGFQHSLMAMLDGGCVDVPGFELLASTPYGDVDIGGCLAPLQHTWTVEPPFKGSKRRLYPEWMHSLQLEQEERFQARMGWMHSISWTGEPTQSMEFFYRRFLSLFTGQHPLGWLYNLVPTFHESDDTVYVPEVSESSVMVELPSALSQLWNEQASRLPVNITW